MNERERGTERTERTTHHESIDRDIAMFGMKRLREEFSLGLEDTHNTDEKQKQK